MKITLAELLKDSAYKLGQFKPKQIAALRYLEAFDER